MILDKEFFDNLNKLENHKANPGLKDFFDAVDKLKKLGEEINGIQNKKSSEKSKLDKQAQCLTKQLEENKIQIAKRTKTQKEYDAVYECIDYLDKHFNYQK